MIETMRRSLTFRLIFFAIALVLGSYVLSYAANSLGVNLKFNSGQYLDGVVTFNSSLAIAIILSQIGILKSYVKATQEIIFAVLMSTIISIFAWGFADSDDEILNGVTVSSFFLFLASLSTAILLGYIVRLLSVYKKGDN